MAVRCFRSYLASSLFSSSDGSSTESCRTHSIISSGLVLHVIRVVCLPSFDDDIG